MRVHIKKAQAYAVAKIVEANIRQDGNKWHYADGWSDERIASEHNLVTEQVAKIRRTLFGQLRAPRQERGKSLDAAVMARIDQLERRLERLEGRLAKSVYANSDGLTAWTGKL